MDETSWVVFVGVADEHHGNAYQSNEQRGQHAHSVHLQAVCVWMCTQVTQGININVKVMIVKKEKCFLNILPPSLPLSTHYREHLKGWRPTLPS
jgi:hypothetical protein